jgi:hypothetical protein
VCRQRAAAALLPRAAGCTKSRSLGGETVDAPSCTWQSRALLGASNATETPVARRQPIGARDARHPRQAMQAQSCNTCNHDERCKRKRKRAECATTTWLARSSAQRPDLAATVSATISAPPEE